MEMFVRSKKATPLRINSQNARNILTRLVRTTDMIHSKAWQRIADADGALQHGNKKRALPSRAFALAVATIVILAAKLQILRLSMDWSHHIEPD